MTKRGIIITSSVIVGIISILTILFGFVFRVKKIDICFDKDFCYAENIQDIISSSEIKKGKSIFGVDKDKARLGIEHYFPYAKVDSVNISNASTIKIQLSTRTPFYYVNEGELYYILDEDCKVLEIGLDGVGASKYIMLNDVFNIGQEITAGQFLNNEYTNVCSELYKALYSNAVLNIGEDADQDGQADEKYLDREDMLNIISSIGFSQIDELEGKVDRLNIYTKGDYGVKIEITKPSVDLDTKINMAFSALKELQKQDMAKTKSGTISVRFSYDDDNNMTLKCEYHA